ncbi:uncharacterized protein METZ01_LOCUS472167 [marine metagenome]|uniref:Uncharacterized protein n=1 Tax=marine metagenome TaxID=408172 RepID=A0A383BHN7_9ZZZZ
MGAFQLTTHPFPDYAVMSFPLGIVTPKDWFSVGMGYSFPVNMDLNQMTRSIALKLAEIMVGPMLLVGKMIKLTHTATGLYTPDAKF